MNRYKHNHIQLSLFAFLLFLVACSSETAVPVTTTATSAPATAVAADGENEPAAATRIPASQYADLEIVTLLPRDAIPAIDDPQFLTVPEADELYDADETVIGVSFNGEARAYSVPLLSNHEIVNDTVGSVKIAVTW